VNRVKTVRFGGLCFSWDERKALANERKHRIRFEEAVTVFLDPLARLFDDPDHSANEDRFLLVGHSLGGNALVVVHGDRAGTIRIISARRVTPREHRDYESHA
jgi:uncharacterized protein